MKRKALLLNLMILTMSISGTSVLAKSVPSLDKSVEKPDKAGNTSATSENKILLGKSLFMDGNLSEPAGQACVSCHAFGSGWADPDRSEATSRGAKPNRFGNRNTPMAAYARFTPDFHFEKGKNGEAGLYVGGQFLDGREPTLEDQAKQPFFNKLEMNNPDEKSLIKKVKKSAYADLFRSVYGEQALDDPKKALDHIGDAIAAFERTDAFAPFTSKFDYVQAGKATFTEREQRGFDLFKAEDKGNCAACHPAESESGKALFTDFTYDNLGGPRNFINPFNTLDEALNPDGMGFRDKGLGSGDNKMVAKDKLVEQLGKFKVPSLRNVAVTAPYTHNGVFKTLKEVVDFYNTRDVVGAAGYVKTPEVAENVNKEELGDLKLSEQEVLDIVAFMETLTDGYQPDAVVANTTKPNK